MSVAWSEVLISCSDYTTKIGPADTQLWMYISDHSLERVPPSAIITTLGKMNVPLAACTVLLHLLSGRSH